MQVNTLKMCVLKDSLILSRDEQISLVSEKMFNFHILRNDSI